MIKTKATTLLILFSFVGFHYCAEDPNTGNETDLGFARLPETSFRVLSWNVNRDSFARHPEQFRAVMSAVNPDIFLLDEVTENSSAREVVEVLMELNGPADTLWNVSFGAAGEYQRSIIASRFPVQQVPEFRWIAFPHEQIKRFTAMVEAKRRTRLLKNLEGGVAANAAVVKVDGKQVFNIVVDFQCCGDDGTWEDQRREFEAKMVHEATSKALSRLEVDGVILSGDLNLVGTSTPLRILQQPLPSNYGSLEVVGAKHLDGKTKWTWDGRGTEFPNGKLDFALYNANQLEVLRSFVFDTETMPPTMREKYGFEFGLSRTLSDHRPIVVDYRWKSR
ncbi:MAG: endonuclease/exonuclease/phosphatase family protein [bacterium]